MIKVPRGKFYVGSSADMMNVVPELCGLSFVIFMFFCEPLIRRSGDILVYLQNSPTALHKKTQVLTVFWLKTVSNSHGFGRE